MQRMYANGFSSGASFTWQMTLLNRSENWFRGYAPMSFTPNKWMLGLSDPFGVEQLYLNDPAVANSAAIAYMTVVNGSHAWPLTGSDPTGRGLVTHDVDWAKRLSAFWTSYAGMNVANPAAWTRC